MKKIVVYDSFFGNTAVIAEEIGKALGEDTLVIKVHALKLEMINDYDLIVIGSPTRAFSCTKEIKAFTKKIEAKDSLKIAVFDTRMRIDEKTPKILKVLEKRFGYSNDTIDKILLKKGITPTIPSEGFYVTGNEGPLEDSEMNRSAEWIKQIL